MKLRVKTVSHFSPRIIHVEGIEVFDESDITRVFSEVIGTFRSSPKIISSCDENENPSKRTVELEPGILTGVNNDFGRDNKETTEFKYFAWELPKSEFQAFIKYANDPKPLEDCRGMVAKEGFMINNVEDGEIAEVAEKLEWIAATAYLDGLTHILTLYIRIKYDPPPNGNQLRRRESILEKAVEMYFLGLKGFSYKNPHCIVPSVPKVVSLSILVSEDFMIRLNKEFYGALQRGVFAINEEILEVLELIGYDGAGYPTVIRESKNLYQIIWQGGLARDGRTFYFVDFTDLDKFIVERLKHSLPLKANFLRGNTELISDILDYYSILFSFLNFYKAMKLDVLREDYVNFRSHLYEKFSVLTAKKYNKIFLELLRTLAKLQKFQAELDEILKRFLGGLTVSRRFNSPEIALSQFNLFDSVNLADDESTTIPLTFFQSLILLKKRTKANMNLESNRLTESAEKTIALINSRIQISETRINTYIIVFTAILVVVAIISLFGLKL